jgi:hypothetical protein
MRLILHNIHIIVLVDEDVEKYLNGTLVFYEENNNTDIR